MTKRLSRIGAGLCCTVVVGCYQRTSENDGLVFSFQPWVPLLVALVGLAAVPVGVVLFRRGQRGWGSV
jgi:hypothetical protein